MADTVQTLIDEIVDEGQFDATQAQALRWLNRRHRAMVAETRAFRKRVSAGVTVVGTAFYAVPDIVELLEFTVGTVPYARARRGDIYGYSQGTVVWTGPSGSGLMVEDATSAGVGGLTLVPSPATAGLALEAFAAVFPADLLSTDAATALKVDPDCYDGLVAGAISTGLARLAQRPDLAAAQEAIYQAAVEKMRQRVRRRLRGAGPSQIRVQGVNA